MGLNYPRSKYMNLFEHNRTVHFAKQYSETSHEKRACDSWSRFKDVSLGLFTYTVYIEHRNQTGSVFLRGIRLTL